MLKRMNKMKIQQILILIKPDGLLKSLTGNILSMVSETKLKIVGAKAIEVTKELAQEHYKSLKEENYFDELIKYIMGDYHTRRVLALVYEGEDAISKIRTIVGSTNPEKAHPITIRGKYGRITQKGVFENAIHASENEQEAEREIKLWFKPEELTSKIYPSKTDTIEKQELVWE